MLGLGLGLFDVAARVQPDAGEPLPDPLAPTEASQPLSWMLSVRKAVPAYAGNCMQWRDSGNTLRTLGFTADPTPVINLASTPSWGNGTFFSAATWYDQSGNGRNYTSINSVRPQCVLNALTSRDGYAMPGIDFRDKSQHLATTATFLNVGGTQNLAVFFVVGTYGWSSAGAHARNPGVSGVNGALMGYGTGTNDILVHGAYTGNGESAMYFRNGELFVERGPIPDLSRVRVIWFNQKGAVVSGGSDSRILFQDRPHGVAEVLGVRATLGTNGALTQSHNGPVWEHFGYQNAEPMSDEECQRIAIGLVQWWGTQIGKARYPDQHELIISGQSLAQYLATADSAASGLTADAVTTRLMVPAIKSRLSINDSTKTLELYCGDVAYGGTSCLKKSDQTTGYWWNQDLDIPGDMLLQWQTNALSQLRRAPRYKKTLLIDCQGEADALVFNGGAGSGSYTLANWKACKIKQLTQQRAWIGRDVPIGLGCLGRQNGQDVSMRNLRKLQAEIAAEMDDVYLMPDIYHLDRQDTVHLAKCPPDSDGFAVRGEQIVRLFCFLFGTGQLPWDAPYVSGWTFINATTADVRVLWPNTGGGNDISPSTGILGFAMKSSGGAARTISSAVRQNSNTIRLTGIDLTATDLLDYNPFPAALDRTKFVVDNTPGLPMPLRPAWDIVAM